MKCIKCKTYIHPLRFIFGFVLCPPCDEMMCTIHSRKQYQLLAKQQSDSDKYFNKLKSTKKGREELGL